MNDKSPICPACFGGDDYLTALVDKGGIEATCSICGEECKTITLDELAERVHDVFTEYVYQGPEVRRLDDEKIYYQQDGETTEEIIYQVLDNIDERLMEPLLEILRRRHQRSVQKGGEDYYGGDEMWIISVEPTEEYAYVWDEFVELAKHQGRFFNEHAKQHLEKIFAPLLSGELHDGKAPVLQIGGEENPIRYVLRARQANTKDEQEVIFANPARELGPPPPRLRIPGRMNAAGVRAFYGSTDIETAVAEARTPVGGTAIVGAFEFVDPVKVLDLRKLEDARIRRTSYFDPSLPERVAYGDFVRKLHDFIRAPVLPGAEELDYLPTQMIAEFLETKGLAGVIFSSSLVSAQQDETKALNIVLFANSSIVEGELSLPMRTVIEVLPSIGLGEGVEFLEEKAVMYKERTYSQEELEKDAAESYPMLGDALEPTLRLVEDRLVLVEVKGIRYDVAPMKVSFMLDQRV